MNTERKLAHCAFEDERGGVFCPIAQEESPPDSGICHVCINANSQKTTQDITLLEFLKLHPELNHTQAVRLLRKHLDKNPPPIDSTPLKSCHQRLRALPDTYREKVLANLEE